MDYESALAYEPPVNWDRVTVIDSHAGGEPFRVVVDGLPEIPGETVLRRRRYAMANLDDLRRALMWEPRGHADMYGGWIGSPVAKGSDLSVLFLHNDGFSTMCGHGVIAMGTVLLETGMLPPHEPETSIRIDTPAGTVSVVSSVSSGRVTGTRFRNVSSFVADLDATIDVDGLGEVRYDLAFGGAFYALVTASDIGVRLDDAARLIDAGRRIKGSITAARDIVHPDDPDLGFLYGVIFTGPPESPRHHSRNVCVFADGEIDRSPTGTGVSSRLAVMSARGEIGVDEEIAVESIVGSVFRGRIVERSEGPPPTIIPEISGTAHLTGRSEYWLDPDDPLGRGFLLR